MSAGDLYDDLREIGAEIDHHESDLYVKATPETERIVRASGRTFGTFRSQVDGCLWYDVPFAFSPWWERRTGRR